MKEHPIIFSTPMVKAILAGTKTMTRRVIKPQPVGHGDNWWSYQGKGVTTSFRTGEQTPEMLQLCPYGQPGDELWVRETWNVCDIGYDGYNGADEAGYPLVSIPVCKPEYRHMVYYKADGNDEPPWRPSIFMPRWASRITLKVASIRIERIQDITEKDAIAEGMGLQSDNYRIPEYWESYRKTFAVYWDSINFKRGYGWDVNPWVWVVEFERVK